MQDFNCRSKLLRGYCRCADDLAHSAKYEHVSEHFGNEFSYKFLLSSRARLLHDFVSLCGTQLQKLATDGDAHLF